MVPSKVRLSVQAPQSITKKKTQGEGLHHLCGPYSSDCDCQRFLPGYEVTRSVEGNSHELFCYIYSPILGPVSPSPARHEHSLPTWHSSQPREEPGRLGEAPTGIPLTPRTQNQVELGRRNLSPHASWRLLTPSNVS